MIERALFVVAVALAPLAAVAQTTTSSVVDGMPLARVEARSFTHDGRVFVRAGFSWWSRDDLRINPGVTVEASWYLTETIGIDLISVTGYFSQLAATADALRRQTGLLPDSQKPLLRAMLGARWGFVYGKILLEDAGVVLHLDAALRGHLGAIITDASANPGADLGLTLQLRVRDHVVVWLDGGWLAAYEAREGTSFASGLSLSAGVGWAW